MIYNYKTFGVPHGQVYSKGCLLSDSELLSHTGKSGSTMGLPVWSTEVNGPDSVTNYYVISLDQLPEEIKASARRVKVFYELNATRDTLTLTPSTQLSKIQADTCFSAASNQYKHARPQNVMSGGLKTLPELIELAGLIDNELEQQMRDDAAITGMELAEEGQTTTGSKALEGLDLENPNPAPKKKSRKGGAAAAKAAAVAAADSVVPTPSYPALLDSEGPGMQIAASGGPGSASSKKKLDREKEIAQMDGEMQKVARVHHQTSRTNTAKSLIDLTPAKFMQEGTDHAKGHAIVNVLWLQLQRDAGKRETGNSYFTLLIAFIVVGRRGNM